jgi:hypothetical protein
VAFSLFVSTFPKTDMAIRKVFLLWSFVLLSGIALGSQTPSKPATFSGVVKDLRSGAPVADARVRIAPISQTPTTQKGVTAITGEDGQFTITGLAPGRYSVEVNAVLYFRPRRNAGATNVTLGSEEVMRGVELGLMPTGVISGRVLDEAGEPMRSVDLQALQRGYADCTAPIPNCGQRWIQVSGATSDDRGEYRLFGLRPGAYRIRANDAKTTEIGPLFYPGVSDPQEAQSVSVESGQERRGIDVSIRRERAFVLTFKFAGTADFGYPQIAYRRKGESTLENAKLADLGDGVRRLANLSPGSYELHAHIQSKNRDGAFYSGMIPFTIVDRDVDLGLWNVPASVPVAGRIRMNDLAPRIDVQRLRITFWADEGNLSGSYQEVRHDPNDNSDRWDITPDGRFIVRNVAVGQRFGIQVSYDSSDSASVAVLTAARVGAEDVMDSGYLVTGSQEPLDLFVGGSESVGSVAGRVADAKGAIVPGGVVVLVPSLERQINPKAFRIARADEAGGFKMQFILPGEYRLLAWEDIELGAALSPEFLKDFFGRGQSVSVTAGLSRSVTVEAIPAVD